MGRESHDAEASTYGRVLAELRAARKAPDGLTPASMADCPVIVELLADGDPLLAFTRLETRILERIELDDDTMPLNAAAYSLGLASTGHTHLERLNDFGQAYGYEARQARRHSDTGLRQVAILVCSNWIVETTPALEVFLSQQPDGGFAVHITTERPRHIDMRPVTVQRYCANGEPCTTWQDFVPAPRFENIAAAHSDGGNESPQDDLRVRRHLVEPLMLSPPGRGEVPGLRIAWPGEVWPCFQLHLAGPLQSNTTLSSRTLGNAMTIALSRVAA